MQGNFKMLRTVLFFASMCSVVHSSGVHHLGAPIDSAPVVTAASSQYFQRTFNRLVAAPPLVPVAPAPPVFIQPAQALPVPVPFPPQRIPFQSVQPVQQFPVQVQVPFPPQRIPFQPVQPVQQVPVQVQPPQPAQPVEPNVAIAIATAQAAPVATILLPPYPFGFPPGYGFIPQQQPSNVDEKTQEPEQTTTKTTTQIEVKTTAQEPESTTPLSPAIDNSFGQASNQDVNFKQYLAPAAPRPQAQPSNQDVNFRQYLAPAPERPQEQPSNQNVNFKQYLAPASQRPQAQPSNQNVNFRQYLAPNPQWSQPQPQPQPSQQAIPYDLPQPLPHHDHYEHQHSHVHLHPLPQGKPQKLKTLVEIVKAPLAYIAPPPLPQYPHNHEAIKVVKHVHTFVPARAKLIIRPVSHHHTRSVPVKVFEYKPSLAFKAASRALDVGLESSREAEFTTFRPFPGSNTKPPRL